MKTALYHCFSDIVISNLKDVLVLAKLDIFISLVLRQDFTANACKIASR